MKMFRLAVLIGATSLTLPVGGLQRTGRLLAAPAAARPAEGQSMEVLLRAFASIHPIDIHVHVYEKSDPAFFGMLKSLDLHVVDILVVGDDPGLWKEFATPAQAARYSKGLDPQRSDALAVVRASEGRAVLCTTFDPYKFPDPQFTEQAIQQLNQDFADGAVAVKIWKNLGMEIRKSHGSFLMADDPILEPIYRDISNHHRTLIAHLAEPDVCWQPPDPNNPELAYFRENPRWYMYLHPDYPSKQAILAAQDHILEMNPKLRYLGAHMGCMESNVDQIAARFDKYPNFAIETGDRLYALLLQPRDKVRAFLIKYQDRVLYGTDHIFPWGAKKGTLEEWRKSYTRDWGLFATDQTFELEGRKFRGLKLPQPTLRKIFHDNALKWVPGVVRN